MASTGKRGQAYLSTLALSALLAGCLAEPPPAPPAEAAAPAPLPEWVVPALPKVDAKTLLENHAAFVTAFPQRTGGTDTHKGARDHLAAAFEKAGLEVWRQAFEADGTKLENVCGVKLGSVEPRLWVVVGGHYDTTTTDAILLGDPAPSHAVSQGAYDDGSGTWITVELAKAFAPVPTYYSVLFCAFDAEEQGLLGSRRVYNTLVSAETDPAAGFPHPVDGQRAMLDLDMYGICWPVRAPIATDQNSDALYRETDKIRTAMGIPDDMYIRANPNLGSSDYRHWYRGGVPTVFFISDFEELGVPTPVENPASPTVPGVYPFWHQADTVETMMAMAGGPDMLEKGFQTAVDLAAATLGVMALHPEIALDPEGE